MKKFAKKKAEQNKKLIKEKVLTKLKKKKLV